MKKLLLAAVVLSLAFTAKAFAEEAKKADVNAKPATTAVAPVKADATKPTTPATTPTAKPTTPTTTTAAKVTPTPAPTAKIPTLKGNYVSWNKDKNTVTLKGSDGKEYTLTTDPKKFNANEYKVGDNVEFSYDKSNLTSIAKAK